MSSRRAFGVFLGLVITNFLFAALAPSTTAHMALDRSYFQGIAVLTCYIICLI